MSESRRSPGCLICGMPLAFRITMRRKSQKPCVVVTCPRDARHFHGFINDRAFVDQVLVSAERVTP